MLKTEWHESDIYVLTEGNKTLDSKEAYREKTREHVYEKQSRNMYQK